MTLRPPTPEQIRALVEEVRLKDPSARVIGVRAEPVWASPTPIPVGEGSVEVRSCPSVLAVRAAIADHARSNGLLVVLTDCDEHELGLDVTTRLAKRRLLSLDPWALLRARMGVSGLDPAFIAEQWLADALLHHEPRGGWPPTQSGFLDVDAAWRVLRHHWLGLTAEQVDLSAVVGWLAAGEGLVALRAAAESDLVHCLNRIEFDAGAPAKELVEMALDGRGDDIVPLGLAAAVVFGDPTPSAPETARVAEARIHFAYRVGDRQIDTVAARLWADAAHTHTARAKATHGISAVEAWFGRAEQILHDVGAYDRAIVSDWLPAGFEQRLARVGELLGRYLDEPSSPLLESVEAAVEIARRHAVATERPGNARIETLDSALRLARRRLEPAAPPAPSLATAAICFAADSAFVDRCRLDLHAGDREPALVAVLGRLLFDHDEQREAENRRFGELLAAWSALEPTAPEPSDRLLPIERVLDVEVGPLAALAPVLLIVADGMSQPVASEVVEDLDRTGWVPLAPETGQLPQIVAMLPTVTEVSRASLLSGRPCTGLASAEKTAFAADPGLRGVSAAGPPPALFHKAEITSPDGAALSVQLRAAIGDTTRRVVGVVVNTIDDHLARGQQLRVRWTSGAIAPLDALLAEAAAAGRVVVMTSDHGHIIDHGTVYRPVNDAGERWRPAVTPPSDGELEVTGPRVLLGGDRIIAPWTERLRYGTPKHGYHGGLTPQEVLVPFVVLARADSIPAGWEPTRQTTPAWWQRTAVEPEPVLLQPITTRAPVLHRSSVPTLFDEEPPSPPEEPGWIAALFASEVYASQRAAAGRQALDNDRARALLSALDRRGATALLDALAVDADVPVLRIRGAITSLRRVLNVDGYDVVSLGDDDTVTLNKALLAVQFGVEQST